MKDRLKEIKDLYGGCFMKGEFPVEVDIKDFKWLIEQLELYITAEESAVKRLNEALKRIKELEAAFEKYLNYEAQS